MSSAGLRQWIRQTSQKRSHVKFVRRLEQTVDTAIVPKKSEAGWHDPEEWDTPG